MQLTVQGIDYQLLIPEDNNSAIGFQSYFEKNGNYEAVMVALLTRLIGTLPKPVFVDLGAFIGYYTFYCSKLLSDNARLYSVESNIKYVELLQQTVRLNQSSNVEIIHAALSDKEEEVYIDGTSVSAVDTSDVMMKAETFDSVCKRVGFNPNVAKMDVHGFEGKMLGGMQQVLKESLQYLLLELHPNVYLEKYTPGITRMQILDMLENAGFKNYYVAGHRYTWSDGMKRYFETGNFSYQPLTRENRGMLLFDRHNHVFVVSSKIPLENIIGPSVIDPSQE